jgi:hypothetical protein
MGHEGVIDIALCAEDSKDTSRITDDLDTESVVTCDRESILTTATVGAELIPSLENDLPQRMRSNSSVTSIGSTATMYDIRVALPSGETSLCVVQRRYSEFYALHRALRRTQGIDNLPEMPPKSWFRKRLSTAFMSRRQEKLGYYLQAVSSKPEAQPLLLEFLKLSPEEVFSLNNPSSNLTGTQDTQGPLLQALETDQEETIAPSFFSTIEVEPTQQASEERPQVPVAGESTALVSDGDELVTAGLSSAPREEELDTPQVSETRQSTSLTSQGLDGPRRRKATFESVSVTSSYDIKSFGNRSRYDTATSLSDDEAMDETGSWLDACGNSYEIVLDQGAYIFKRHSDGAEGTLIRAFEEWLVGDVEGTQVRLKLTDEGKLDLQLKTSAWFSEFQKVLAIRQEKTPTDGPGIYVIVDDCLVTESKSTDSRDVSELKSDQRVRVLEVVRVEEAERMRGRIEQPEGWISLQNTSSGDRWAIKVADS